MFIFSRRMLVVGSGVILILMGDQFDKGAVMRCTKNAGELRPPLMTRKRELCTLLAWNPLPRSLLPAPLLPCTCLRIYSVFIVCPFVFSITRSGCSRDPSRFLVIYMGSCRRLFKLHMACDSPFPRTNLEGLHILYITTNKHGRRGNI